MLNRLVRCDLLGAVYSDLHGRVTRAIDVMPRGAHTSTLDTTAPLQNRSEHDGPFYLGVMHWREHPAQAEHCGHLGEPGDGVCIGFRNGTDAIVQYGFHRDDQMFTDRDLALLHMIGPVLQRLVRERAHSHAPLDHHADRAPRTQPRRRGPEQRPDRRDPVHLGRHRPQAPRARVPKARCEQQDRRRRAAPWLRRAHPGPARSARQIRLKANTQLIPRGRIHGVSRRTNTHRYPTGVNRTCRRGTYQGDRERTGLVACRPPVEETTLTTPLEVTMMLTRRSVVGSAAVATTALALGPDALAAPGRRRRARSAEGGQAVLDWEQVSFDTVYGVLGTTPLARPSRSAPPCSASSRSPCTARPAGRRTWAAARSRRPWPRQHTTCCSRTTRARPARSRPPSTTTMDAVGPGHARTKGSRIGADAAREMIAEPEGRRLPRRLGPLQQAGHRPLLAAGGRHDSDVGGRPHARPLARLAPEPGRHGGADQRSVLPRVDRVGRRLRGGPSGGQQQLDRPDARTDGDGAVPQLHQRRANPRRRR